MLRRLISKHQCQIVTIVEENEQEEQRRHSQLSDARSLLANQSITALDITADAFEKLIFGFLRQLMALVASDMECPQKILQLCQSFYNTSWANIAFNLFNPYIGQSLYGKIIKSHPQSENVKCHRLFSSDIGYNIGIHKWKLKYFASGDAEYGGIGICSNTSCIYQPRVGNKNKNKNNNTNANRHRFDHRYSAEIANTNNFRKQPWITHRSLGNVYYWCQNMHRIYHFSNGKGRTIDDCGKTYVANDIITVILDCNSWTLKFLLNGENICGSEDGILVTPNITYFPIVAVYHWKDTFSVVTK